MSIELKPCPFCGGRLATDGSAPGHADDCYIVLLLRKHGNPDDFHAAWNRRAASDAPAEGREAVDERAAFEADAKRLGMPLENSGGHYANIRTRNRWLGWQARAALSTAPTMSEAARDVLRKAARRYDEMMDHLGGCTDGGCVIKRSTGMHTNGGCKCPSDKLKMQKAMYVANNLRAAVSAIDRAAAKGESE